MCHLAHKLMHMPPLWYQYVTMGLYDIIYLVYSCVSNVSSVCRTTDSILCSQLQWSLASRWSIVKKGPGTSLWHASRRYRSTWGGFWTNSHYTPQRWLIGWTCSACVFVILTFINAQLTSFYLLFSLQLSHGYSYYIVYHHSVSCTYAGIYCLIMTQNGDGLARHARVWSICTAILY